MRIDFEGIERIIQERGRVQTLENGIILVTEDTPGLGLVQGHIRILAGSTQERDEDLGTMHFLEHMSFDGSENFPDRKKRNLEASLLGLETNANTRLHSVNYPIFGANSSKYMLPANFLNGFERVADLVFNPLLSQESWEREQHIVQEERKMKEQRKRRSPYTKANDQIQQRLSRNNQLYLREILGSEKTIRDITPEKLRAYHSEFFVGNNTLVSPSGDLNGSENIEEKVKKILDGIRPGKKANQLHPQKEPEFGTREVMELYAPVPGKTLVVMYFQTPGIGTLEDQAVGIANYILGNGVNSLLFQDLRERRGLVYAISSSKQGTQETGLLQIQYEIDPERLNESLKAIDDCLYKLKRGEFNPALIDAYKDSTVPNVLNAFNSGRGVINELTERVYRQLGNKSHTSLDQLKTELAVTKQDVIDAANRYLGEKRLTTITRPHPSLYMPQTDLRQGNLF